MGSFALEAMISISKEQYWEVFRALRQRTEVLDCDRTELTPARVAAFVDDLALRDACIDEMQREMSDCDYRALAEDLQDAWVDCSPSICY